MNELRKIINDRLKREREMLDGAAPEVKQNVQNRIKALEAFDSVADKNIDACVNDTLMVLKSLKAQQILEYHKKANEIKSKLKHP